MPDIVDRETRSRMMSGIRGRDTKPEVLIRKGLFAKGFRYRIHVRTLPGKPDIVFPQHGAVILINGCFWHGHDCPLFKWPDSNADFWKKKIRGNRKRDRIAKRELEEQGWRVLTIWECAFRGRNSRSVDDVISLAARWLRGRQRSKEIREGA